MYQLNQPPGRTVIANGREFLFFSGYSYLGMGQLPAFNNLVKEGVDRYGILHPSSRVSNTQLQLYRNMERVLSSLTGSEETVTFSSGFLAGRAVADFVSRHQKNIFVAPNAHPAIDCGKPLPADDWKAHLVKTINQSPAGSFVLFMDGVNPLNATVANFSFLQELKPGKHLTCVIDDSHGIGLLGPIGNGISHLFPKMPNVELIVTYSLSKAFHINGGAVSCSRRLARQLCESPYYTGATAISPALAFAFIEAQTLYHTQLQQLQNNIAKFIEATSYIGCIGFYPHLPIFVLRPGWDAAYFDAHNIIISSFAYPDPSGNKVNRVVLNALHTCHDLFKLSNVINHLHQHDLEV